MTAWQYKEASAEKRWSLPIQQRTTGFGQTGERRMGAGVCSSAVMPESVSEVVTGEDELIVTVGELNVNVGATPDVLLEMAENVTVPVKLLAGVAVMVTARNRPARRDSDGQVIAGGGNARRAWCEAEVGTRRARYLHLNRVGGDRPARGKGRSN